MPKDYRLPAGAGRPIRHPDHVTRIDEKILIVGRDQRLLLSQKLILGAYFEVEGESAGTVAEARHNLFTELTGTPASANTAGAASLPR